MLVRIKFSIKIFGLFEIYKLGDYGGALYRTGTNAAYVGLTSFSPNFRRGSTCQDGHNTIVQIITTDVATFITNTLAANP